MAADKISEAPKTPLGGRPVFLNHPDNERMLAMVLAVGAEVSVLYDRLDTLERVAVERERFSLDDLEHYVPSPEVMAARANWRRDYLGRMLRILYEDLDDNDGGARSADYAELMAALARDGA